MTAHVPRFNRRVLTVFLLVGLPILALGVGIVLAIGQVRLRDTFGQHLEQVARQTAAAVDAYVYRRILDVSLLARTPEVRREAAAGSVRPLQMAVVEQIDRAWRAAEGPPPEQAALLDNAAARYLADITSHDLIYREILLTDRYGRLVAASGPTTDYYQADEDWWQAAYDDGRRGRVSVTDVRWDESARVFAVEIAVPVQEPGGEGLAGVLKVVSDSREMLAIVGGLQLGATGEAMLLRDNGSIVFSRQPVEPNARFFATEPFLERVELMRAGDPDAGAYFRATTRGASARLVGVAASQLVRSFPNLTWYVAVTQAEDELLAPVRALGWYLLLALGLTAIAVLAFALWFSMRLAAPPVDVDMHLVEHPPVLHVGEAEEPAVERQGP